MAFSTTRRRFVEQRQSPRQRANDEAAWIDAGDGSQRRDCTLWDISEAGVRITIDRPVEVPSEFSLVMGAIRRRCMVIWRSDQQIGARYVTAPDWSWTA
jgi:hypothetical protein